jgi:hypothetical protein
VVSTNGEYALVQWEDVPRHQLVERVSFLTPAAPPEVMLTEDEWESIANVIW